MLKVRFLLAIVVYILLLGCNFNHIKKLRIVYVNDTHGRYDPSMVSWIDKDSTVGGLATLGGFLAQQRKEFPQLLFVDAGDSILGTPLAYLTEGESTIDLLNTLDFDAANLGINEFAYGIYVLQKRIKAANFPFLNANIIAAKTKSPFLDTPFKIVEKNGIRIGIIGIQGSRNFDLVAKPRVDDTYTTKDENTVLQKWIDQLRDEVDLIVVLAHQGFTGLRTSAPFVQYETLLYKDERMAMDVQGIDILVQGNSRIAIAKPIKVGNTLIISAGAYSYFAGVLDLKVNLKKKKIVQYKNQIYPLLTNKYPPLMKTQERIEFWKKKFESQLSITVGQSASPMTRSFFQSSPMGNFVADALLSSIKGADFAMFSASLLEKDLPEGLITYSDLLSAIPLPYHVVQIKILGENIAQAFTTAATLRHGIIQVSQNVEVILDFQGWDESIQKLMINGKPLELDKLYTINTTCFMAQGGGGFIKGDVAYKETDITVQKATEDYLKQFTVYQPRKEKRIRVINIPVPTNKYRNSYKPIS